MSSVLYCVHKHVVLAYKLAQWSSNENNKNGQESSPKASSHENVVGKSFLWLEELYMDVTYNSSP